MIDTANPPNIPMMTVKIGDFQMQYCQDLLAHTPCSKVWKEIRKAIKEDAKNAKQENRNRA